MKEKILTLMGSEPALAEQYFATLRRSEYSEPEKALLLAILEDAIHSFKKYCSAKDRVGRERFQEAEQWIMRTGDDWLFSFDNVCELLGLDPQFVRRGVQQWKKTRLREAKASQRKGPPAQVA